MRLGNISQYFFNKYRATLARLLHDMSRTNNSVDALTWDFVPGNAR